MFGKMNGMEIGIEFELKSYYMDGKKKEFTLNEFIIYFLLHSVRPNGALKKEEGKE
jgi:hypothetical protein